MKNIPAAREDAKEEEQKIPKAGDVLTEQDAYLLKNTRNIFENLGRNLLEENKRKEQALHRIDEITLESAGHKRRADEMAEEARLAHADIRRKDEEINKLRAERERREAAHAEELSRMRAECLAIKKAAAMYLHETSGTRNRTPALLSHAIPRTLDTPEARSLIRKLTDGQILDERWQPVNLSNAEKGILAQYLSAELDIRNQWQSFATLWGMKPETLRRAAAKAMEQKKSLVFQDRLKGLLRV